MGGDRRSARRVARRLTSLLLVRDIGSIESTGRLGGLGHVAGRHNPGQQGKQLGVLGRR